MIAVEIGKQDGTTSGICRETYWDYVMKTPVGQYGQFEVDSLWRIEDQKIQQENEMKERAYEERGRLLNEDLKNG